ncbi:MAG: hypothetical protein L6R48_13605 [Planctomycetes bacterium]|nr:hypothetical protein [Planctomycetota bacterium]
MTRLRRLVLGLLAGAALPAVEARVADLRLLVEARPTALTFAWSDAQGGRSGDDSFARAGALGAGIRWGWGAAGRPHLLLAGLDLQAIDERSSTLHHQGALARIEAGYGCALADAWTFALLPGLAAGPTRLALSQGGGIDLSGRAWEPSLRAGVRWTPAEHLALGLEGGWLWSRESLDGGGASLDLRRSGGTVALSLAWVLDASPRRIE